MSRLTIARYLRAWPETVANSPPRAIDVLPGTGTSAFTAQLAPGAQAVSSAPVVGETAAARSRCLPATAVNRPPA